ncbi:MAG: hypothetical protein AAGH41_03735 [Pseudomonadota bacterium]
MTGRGPGTPDVKAVGLLAGGAAVVAAASALFTKAPDAPEVAPEVFPERAVVRGIAEAPDGVLCTDGLLDTDDGCAALSDIKAIGQALLADTALPSQPVTLVHPTDFSAEPRTVDGCDTYAELKRQDWSALSSADMAQEALFYRACGLIILAQEAVETPAAPRLDRAQMVDIDRSTLPTFGEARFGPNDPITQETESPAVWSITNEALLCKMAYLGTADFNGDGVPDHLVEWRLAAREGSFRQVGFGLIEKPRGQAARFSEINPFTM